MADSLEVLLLLVWRHVDYYSILSDPPQRISGRVSTVPLAPLDVSSFGKRSTLRGDEIATLLEHVKRGLTPVLERLDGLHLVSPVIFRAPCVRFSFTSLQPPDIVGVDHHSREGYIEMMCRLILQSISEDRDSSKASVNGDVEGLGSW